jgi:hypothetical protein
MAGPIIIHGWWGPTPMHFGDHTGAIGKKKLAIAK